MNLYYLLLILVEVEVEFKYDAEQADELSINVGDIIKNVVMSEGGWWEGELNGKKGMFPDNFVKVGKLYFSCEPLINMENLTNASLEI